MKMGHLYLADVYSTLVRTASPTNQTHSGMKENESEGEKHRFICLAGKLVRSNSPGSLIGDIIESPEPEKVGQSY